ncbi:MAG: hypothetical protein MZW92_81175 [Comamonadaceae bacterium]|nr:hypothetical protein [Comamonadaceae bacterium]
MTKIVLEAVQAAPLRLALQLARDDYEARRERQRQGVEPRAGAGKYAGRKTDERMHARILALRAAGHSIATARLTPMQREPVSSGCRRWYVQRRIRNYHRGTSMNDIPDSGTPKPTPQVVAAGLGLDDAGTCPGCAVARAAGQPPAPGSSASLARGSGLASAEGSTSSD